MRTEVARLKAEPQRAPGERDILKKAAAYLAKQSGGSTHSYGSWIVFADEYQEVMLCPPPKFQA
jgi:hypothetical protein